MADLSYTKLGEDDVAQRLGSLDGWAVEGGMMTKTFTFDRYKDGVVFASAVGWLADSLDHHPDLLLTYGKVRVAMNTHAVEGLSPYDFELARRIETLCT